MAVNGVRASAHCERATVLFAGGKTDVAQPSPTRHSAALADPIRREILDLLRKGEMLTNG
jgi:hypothetical protein